jgi:glycine/D-amino acid oxidase-like deaminating enzyme
MPGMARSYWLEEALAHDPGRPCPALDADTHADVVIVGGGFAGLWTAIELTSRKPSLSVVLLEADICGSGASGRNAGFLSASWHHLEDLCRLYGERQGLRYAAAISDQIDEIGRWCQEHAVDAWVHHEGILYASTTTPQRSRTLVAEAARPGAGERLTFLDADGARVHVPSPRFVSGAFASSGATVQPGRLVRGLRRVALERGVRIFEGSPVSGIDTRGARVHTAGGSVRAEQLVLTIGAWAAGWRGFRRAFANVVNCIVVTEPIPERLEQMGWHGRVGFVGGPELIYYARTTDDGRVALGGGAGNVLYGGRIDRGLHADRLAEVAADGLLWLFPALEGVRLTHAWCGAMDMTAGRAPFFQTLPPGNVHAGLGFSGHGLAATRLGGKTLASLALGVEDEWAALPVVGPVVGRVPPEPLRWPLARASIWAIESGDRAEREGRRRGRLRGLIGGGPDMYRRRLRSPDAGDRQQP